jgi:membrane protease YdiL (CAAX protease family)
VGSTVNPPSRPPAWALGVGRDGGVSVLPTLALVLLALPLCVAAVVGLLAHGAMLSTGVDPGQRTTEARWANVHRLHGVIGKDLRLLLRDRSFLVQTVGVPVFMVALNLLVNRGSLAVNGSVPALLAYGIGSYAVVFGCFQVLGGEGRALWVLYTLPVTVAAVLRRKVRLWATLGLVFALASLVVFAAARGVSQPLLLLSDFVFVTAGVWAASHLAAAIGILGTDPASDHVPRRPGARYAYLYLFFAATYAFGLRGDDLAGRFVALLVFGTLAFAFWQRACDRLPWLLDPVAKGGATLALADGAAALVIFTIVQGLVLALVAGADLQAMLPSAIAFTIAGGLTTVLFGVILNLRGIDLPGALGLQPNGNAARSLLLGAIAGAVLGALGLGYLHAMRALHWFEVPDPVSGQFTLVLLACLAAPLFEELIFRGLLFQGLTRSVPLRLALPWSAMLFAVVHPPMSWVPVFGLGLATAWVFQRTRFLPAAMVVHSVYNAVVLLVRT